MVFLKYLFTASLPLACCALLATIPNSSSTSLNYITELN